MYWIFMEILVTVPIMLPLDIYGDTCHRALKKFSGKFDRHVESVRHRQTDRQSYFIRSVK